MSLRQKFTFSLLAAVILASAIPACAGAESSAYTNGDVIVVLRPSASGAKISASSFGDGGAGTVAASTFARASGAEVKKVYPALSAAGNSVFVMIHSDDAEPKAYSQELLKNPNVLAASPNYRVRAASITPDDTYWAEQWGMKRINMPDAWERETGSSEVYAAIIDSGIDWTNPDVSANVVPGLGTNTLTSSGSPFDDYGHGTHVAGIIGASTNNDIGVAGINWNIKMIPVKVLDNYGYGDFDTLIAGLNHVANLIEAGYNIRVVNTSLETYDNTAPTHNKMITYPLWRAFKAIDDYNQAIIVTAAGNNQAVVGKAATTYKYDSSGYLIYSPGDYVYPASFPGLDNIITVSAMNSRGKVADYSGTNTDISAPGGNFKIDASMIISTWIQNSHWVDWNGVAVYLAQGTSMAAPHVSGAAALLAAHMPEMTAYQIKQCILGSKNSNYAEGLLDVKAALDYQEYYGYTLASEGTEGRAYDDYNYYQEDESYNYITNYDDEDYNYDYNYTYDNNGGQNEVTNPERNSGGGSGGGCNGVISGFAVVILLPLVKKFMS